MPPTRAIAAVVAAIAAGGCGTAAVSSAPRPSRPRVSARAAGHLRVAASGAASSPCDRAWSRALARVAVRIYDQAVTGRNVSAAVRRLERSRPLADAVGRGDRAAVRAAVAPLLKHQIVRLRIVRRGRLLLSVGTHPAPAPVRGVLRDAAGNQVGSFVLAVTDDRAYAGITQRLTGAAVLLRDGHRRVTAGTAAAGAHTSAFQGEAFPSGALRVSLRIAAAPRSDCAPRAAATAMNATGYVARRLLRAESSSRGVAQTLRYASRDAAFRRAVAARDPAAIRSAIVGFFRNHRFHIVRVRVTRAGRLLNDVGGPYVLNPASQTLRAPSGRSLGRFMLAVQDDTGYIKLVHRFTGAVVLLRTAAGQVPGSMLTPGPASIPARGTVTYRGRRYLARSFDGTAFPSGRLRVSVLVPVSAGGAS